MFSACEVMAIVLPASVESTVRVVEADCTRLILLNSAEATTEVIWSRSEANELCRASSSELLSPLAVAETTVALIWVSKSSIDSPAAIAASTVDSPVPNAVLTAVTPEISPRRPWAMEKEDGLSAGPLTLSPVVTRSCVISSRRDSSLIA